MRHTILIFLVVMALIAYVQRAAISVPLSEIATDLSLSRATWSLGLLQSAWQLGYALCQLPAGAVADRLGARRTLVLSAVLWSVATGVTAVAPTYWWLVVAWTAMGVFQAAALPCAVRTIGRVFGVTELARASGWLGAGMLAGGAVAPVLTAWLLERVGPWAADTGVARWRVCLAGYAMPGLAWAACYWLFTRRTDDDVPAQAVLESERRRETPSMACSRGGAASCGDGRPAESAHAGRWARWRAAVADRTFLLLCGQQFLRAAAMIFFTTWFPTFLRETRGVSVLESGLLTTSAGAAALLGAVLGGYASDRVLAVTGSKRLARQGLAVVGMSLCACLMAGSFFVNDVRAATALIGAGAFAATFGGVAGYTVAIDYGGDRAGTVFGAMNTAGNLGAMLFPVTIGWLVSATGTWNAALITFVVLMAVDAVLWAVLDPRGTFLATAGPAAGTGGPAVGTSGPAAGTAGKAESP